jgi:hypothetical protein
MPWAWARRNCDQVGPVRRGAGSIPAAEDRPHGGGADLVAESGEFAVYASIPPGGILRGQAHDQGADAGADGGSARARVRGGPAAADELPMPAQDRGRGDEQPAAAMSGQKPGEDGDHGPVAPTELWSGCAALQHG